MDKKLPLLAVFSENHHLLGSQDKQVLLPLLARDGVSGV